MSSNSSQRETLKLPWSLLRAGGRHGLSDNETRDPIGYLVAGLSRLGSTAKKVLSAEDPVVEVRHLTRSFRGVRAIDDVSLSIGRDSITGLMGRNGAGKTTLMSLLTGQDFPTAGVVDVYCNIHPEMAATILVLPNHGFTRAKSDGTFAIDGVHPGTWKVFAYTRRALKPCSCTYWVIVSSTLRLPRTP